MFNIYIGRYSQRVRLQNHGARPQLPDFLLVSSCFPGFLLAGASGLHIGEPVNKLLQWRQLLPVNQLEFLERLDYHNEIKDTYLPMSLRKIE